MDPNTATKAPVPRDAAVREEPKAAQSSVTRPLLEAFPGLSARIRFAGLGLFPSPVELLRSTRSGSAEVFIKRDDLSSPIYGGNKVRTLEVLLGQALVEGKSEVVSTGAFGSNHALATVLHAPRLGLSSGVLLFPQRHSPCALDNFVVTASRAHQLDCLAHWSTLPVGIWRWRRQHGARSFVMLPGGATPLGAMGYVSAGLELALQVACGQLPVPRRIVLPVGSCCTSAGLLVGLRVAQRLGLAFAQRVPQIYAVRVTPWPVTSPRRIALLARRTAELLAELTGEPRLAFPLRELRAGLVVDGRYLGAGYGRPTAEGLRAIYEAGAFGIALDTTYSAKAAAALPEVAVAGAGPTLFWATKSSAALPPVNSELPSVLSSRLLGWVKQARAQAGLRQGDHGSKPSSSR